MSDLDDLEATLAAYEKQKWAQLSDQGADGLRRELADLERFLEQADQLDWASDRLIAFRQEKVRILREILQEGAGGTA